MGCVEVELAFGGGLWHRLWFQACSRGGEAWGYAHPPGGSGGASSPAGLVPGGRCRRFREGHVLSAVLTVAVSLCLPGLLAIKNAQDIESRLDEVEKLLKTVIGMPCKVSARPAVPCSRPCLCPCSPAFPPRQPAGWEGGGDRVRREELCLPPWGVSGGAGSEGALRGGGSGSGSGTASRPRSQGSLASALMAGPCCWGHGWDLGSGRRKPGEHQGWR